MNFPILISIRKNYGNVKYSIGGTEKRAIKTYEYFKPRGAELIKFSDENEVLAAATRLKAKTIYNFGMPLTRPTIEKLKKLGTSCAQSTNFVETYSSYIDHNIVISKFEYLKLILMGKIKRENKNVSVVYSPLDVTPFKKEHPNMYIRTEPDEIVIGRIGRTEPTKWSSRVIYFLLWGAFKLKRKRPEKKMTFLFAGMPLLYRITTKIISPLLRRKNIHVQMYPEIKDPNLIPEFYSSLDFFFQTSRIGESFGNVIAESFAAGTPVITDCKYFYLNGKVRPWLYDSQVELIDDGEDGFYANYPSQFYSIVEDVDTKTIIKMKNNAKRKAKTFEKSVVMKELETVLSGESVPLNPDEILNEYLNKTEKFKKIDANAGHLERLCFDVLTFLYEIGEYMYIVIRRGLRLFSIDIEEFKTFYTKMD